MLTATVQGGAVNRLSFGLCSGKRVTQKSVNNRRKTVTIKAMLRLSWGIVIGFIQVFLNKF